MPVLKNHRHELFAQELAAGKRPINAYEAAGYSRSQAGAQLLQKRPEVRGRLDDILGSAAERAGITAERVIIELGRIAFSDIGKAVAWRTRVVREERRRGDHVLVTESTVEDVEFKDSADLDEATRAAIAKVWKSPKGAMRLELHEKRAALKDLAKMFGLFRERNEDDGNVTVNIVEFTDDMAQPPQ